MYSQRECMFDKNSVMCLKMEEVNTTLTSKLGKNFYDCVTNALKPINDMNNTTLITYSAIH